MLESILSTNAFAPVVVPTISLSDENTWVIDESVKCFRQLPVKPVNAESLAVFWTPFSIATCLKSCPVIKSESLPSTLQCTHNADVFKSNFAFFPQPSGGLITALAVAPDPPPPDNLIVALVYPWA